MSHPHTALPARPAPITLATAPGALYAIAVSENFRTVQVSAALAAFAQVARGTNPWPLELPELSIHARNNAHGEFDVGVMDVHGVRHDFLGRYPDLIVWLQRLHAGKT